MKNKKLIFAILGLLIAGILVYFLIPDSSTPEVSPRTIQITLMCDSIPTSANVNTLCNFGQNTNIPNEKFSIDAVLKDKVEWVGKLKNPNEGRIDITNVIYESGTNIFNNKDISGKGGKVIAMVVKGKKNDELKYGLKFTVFNSKGNSVLTDTIDPRVKIIRDRR